MVRRFQRRSCRTSIAMLLCAAAATTAGSRAGRSAPRRACASKRPDASPHGPGWHDRSASRHISPPAGGTGPRPAVRLGPYGSIRDPVVATARPIDRRPSKPASARPRQRAFRARNRRLTSPAPLRTLRLSPGVSRQGAEILLGREAAQGPDEPDPVHTGVGMVRMPRRSRDRSFQGASSFLPVRAGSPMR